MNIQSKFPIGLTGLISLSRRLSRVFSSTTVWKHDLVLSLAAFFMVQLAYLYMTTGKSIAFTIRTSVTNVIPLLFNTRSRFVIAFLPKSKWFLISWLQSLSAVTAPPLTHEKKVTGRYSMISSYVMAHNRFRRELPGNPLKGPGFLPVARRKLKTAEGSCKG